MKLWKGRPATQIVSLKIDGFQAMLNEDGQVVSRSGKPLYNIDPRLLRPGYRYEVYLGDFKLTSSVLRSHESELKIEPQHLYSLTPQVDIRLILWLNSKETPELHPWAIQESFEWALSHNYEGLVIDHEWKLKPKLTFDVPVLGTVPGRGKFSGMVGAIVTPMGRVGTGMSMAERFEGFTVGEIIEVECMELTPDGKFRHPRYVRRRWDKPAEESDA